MSFQIHKPNENNDQIKFSIASDLITSLGLFKYDQIKRMITLTVITLSDAYCIG
jgi:hypothetical protein